MSDRGNSPGDTVQQWADGRLKRVLLNQRERRLRTPWRLLATLVVFVILVLVVSLVATVLPPVATFTGPFVPGLYGTLLYLAVTALLLAGVLGASYLLDRREVTDLGLDLDRQWWRDAGFGLALGAVLPTVVFLVELAAGLVTVTGVLVTDPGALLAFGGATPAWFALVLVVCFFVGVSVFEEVLVRGYLLTNLAEGLNGFWKFDYRWAIALATLATAGLFGVLHASNPNATVLSVVNITLFGVLLGLGYALTDRLGVPVGMHLTWNATVGAVYGFPVSGISVGVTLLRTETTGPELVTGGRFGPEGGLVALLALVVGLALLGWWVARNYGRVALNEAVAVPRLRANNRTR